MNPQASIPVQTLHNPTRSTKAADPELFDGNQDQTKEFIRAIWIAVTMQANTFVDKRMKILYVLSFMRGGMAQVWAANETMAVITGTTHMQTLDIYNQHGRVAMHSHMSTVHKNCEGDTETRPLVCRESLRQGEPNRCDTLTQW